MGQAQGATAAGMHPALAASIAGALNGAAVMRRAQYVSALRAHDWGHQWSDDVSVVQRGAAERRWLREAAAQIDPGFELWNQAAPADQRDGAVL